MQLVFHSTAEVYEAFMMDAIPLGVFLMALEDVKNNGVAYITRG